jgi:hypothetical protein
MVLKPGRLFRGSEGTRISEGSQSDRTHRRGGAGRKVDPNEDHRPPRRVAAMNADKRRGIYILTASSAALIAALLIRWLV